MGPSQYAWPVLVVRQGAVTAFEDMMKKTKALAVVLCAMIALLFGDLTISQEPADALTGSQFNAGDIISNDVFFNSASMTAAQIQAFLVQQEPSCTASAGYPCLKNYTLTTSTIASSGPGLCTGYTGAPSEAASAIIYQVAQACGINPQVLLVTLEKEQSLVSSSAPTSYMYRSAMGYGCPDTSACDSTYYGLFNQLYQAAWQFKRYGNPEGSSNTFTWFPVGKPSQIAYNPQSTCGTGSVTIQNEATAALYYYTPYQPNAAALANLNGAGDSCSAYGNRNFWVIFNNWFGSPTSSAAGDISALYNAQGGASGPLGPATSGLITIPDNGGGYGQAFTGGSIYWTSKNGAFSILGDFRDYYFTLGGAAGPLAWPLSNLISIPSDGGGRGQALQGGSIYGSSFGVFSVQGSIRSEYFANGGGGGTLGWPTADAGTVSANGGGLGQPFSTGSVYSSSAGTFAVQGPILTEYFAAGGAAGTLGWPASEAIPIASNGGGTGQAFQLGSVYTSKTGTFSVSGNIRNFYFSQAGAAGPLGWPTAEQTCSTDISECSQEFAGGMVVWRQSTGGYVASPEIETAYQQSGGVTGPLGYALTGPIAISASGGGLGQVFSSGSIYWTKAAGAFSVVGPIRDFYFANGGSAGALGWPVGNQICGLADGGCSQAFQNGTVFASTVNGGRVSTASIDAAYLAMKGATGTLGLAQSWPITIQGATSGLGQVYQNGSIFWTSTQGAHGVVGAIRDAYFGLGGAVGRLGWPSGDQVCDAAGACTQTFQNGSIAWSAATGAVIH
jgi:uncharacterized protein with LGFP repeats